MLGNKSVTAPVSHTWKIFPLVTFTSKIVLRPCELLIKCGIVNLKINFAYFISVRALDWNV